MRELKTEKGKDSTTGCLLDHEYTKNICRLMAVDLIGQEKLDADPKTVWQIEIVGQLKSIDGINADDAQSTLVSTILE